MRVHINAYIPLVVSVFSYIAYKSTGWKLLIHYLLVFLHALNETFNPAQKER